MSAGDLNNDLQVDIYDLNNLLEQWQDSSNDISNLSNLQSNWKDIYVHEKDWKKRKKYI